MKSAEEKKAVWQGIRDTVVDVFHVFAMIYALWLIYGGVFLIPVFAQRTTEPNPAAEYDLDRRVTTIEGLNLEHRLTVIETLLNNIDNSSTWFRVSTGGTGLLLAKAVVDALRSKRKE